MSMTTDPDPLENAPTVLVVEDDPAIVALVSLGLCYEGYTIHTALDGFQGLRLFEEVQPDLVIVDWLLPGLDGISLSRRIRAASETPIIIITARDAVSDRVTGLDSGADDYIVKPFHIEELLARVRARLRRKTPAANQLGFGDLTLDIETHEVFRGSRRVTLTATEFKVLHHLLRHPRQVLSKESLLEAVWGYDFGGDANIVEQYVHSLRQKIGSPALIQTLRGAGYVLRVEDPAGSCGEEADAP
jgi:two-component system, OmpR family, response regulator MprA